MIFIGYAPNKQAWIFWNPYSNKRVVSTYAKFEETNFILPRPETPYIYPLPDLPTEPEPEPVPESPTHQQPVEEPEEPSTVEERQNEDVAGATATETHNAPEPTNRMLRQLMFEAPGDFNLPADMSSGRSLRPRAMAAFVEKQEWLACMAAMHVKPGVPTSYDEAMKSSAKGQWESACLSEIQSLRDNKTYSVVSLPPGRKAIDSKWVFDLKYSPSGTIDRFKARVVARGFSQVEGIDYQQTFSPVAAMQTVRTFFAVAAAQGLDLQQCDAITAFLNAKLEEEIYLVPPPGFTDGTKVWRLHKALYGLKQAGRQWWKKLAECLMTFGLTPSEYDSCLWTTKEKKLALVTIVDDFAISGDPERTMKFISYLKDCFKIKHLGSPQLFLGMTVERDMKLGTITLGQQKYIEDVLTRFNCQQLPSTKTPVLPGIKIEGAGEGEEVLASAGPYQARVGSIMYLMMCTRPDLAYASSMLSRFNSSPTKRHSQAVERVLQYIKDTKNKKLVLGGSTQVQGWTDSSYLDDRTNSKSTGGYLFKVGVGAVSWRSKLGRLVAKNTCEAEYLAASDAASEGIWLAYILRDLGINSLPVPLWCDNQSALAIARKPGQRGATKHLDVQYHFVRQQVELGTIKFQYVPTTYQLADCLTKALSRPRLDQFMSSVGLAEWGASVDPSEQPLARRSASRRV